MFAPLRIIRYSGLRTDRNVLKERKEKMFMERDLLLKEVAKMKRVSIWILMGLTLCNLLSITCVSSAADDERMEKADMRTPKDFLTIRVAGGVIADDLIFEDRAVVLGGAAAIDVRLEGPIAISLFGESYSKDEFTRAYYGINGCIISKPGLYFGGGFGRARWSVRDTSRTSPMGDFLLGIRRMVSKRVGIYGEFKFCYNSKTEEDTKSLNRWFDSGGATKRPPPFLFDNDITFNVGVFLPLL